MGLTDQGAVETELLEWLKASNYVSRASRGRSRGLARQRSRPRPLRREVAARRAALPQPPARREEVPLLASVTTLLQQAASQPLGLLFAFLLGVVSAVGSACCTLPAVGLLVGYSGARVDADRRAALLSTAAFMAGTVLSLILLGSLAGFVGQMAQGALGHYWKVFAGLVAIVFGLATLKLLPISLPSKSSALLKPATTVGTVGTGLLLGGGLAACSLPCNPGIFIVLGAAVLQGRALWATLLLASFAVGFSLPLGALLLGISFGKTAFLAKRADTAIRWGSGVILLAAGFYFLAAS